MPGCCLAFLLRCFNYQLLRNPVTWREIQLHVAVHLHLQIIVLMALLSTLLTWQSALTGLGVTLSIIPLSIFVGRWQTRIRSHVVQRTDARVKLTGEVLSGKTPVPEVAVCYNKPTPAL